MMMMMMMMMMMLTMLISHSLRLSAIKSFLSILSINHYRTCKEKMSAHF